MRKLKATRELTEGEWVRELEHIDNQLTHILDVFNFLEELFRLSNESEAALGAFNTTPLFWHVFRDCLQESMFMGLGRLCDPSPDAVNVRRVLAGAMAHPEFFSAEALRRRVAKRNLTESLAGSSSCECVGTEQRERLPISGEGGSLSCGPDRENLLSY